MPWHQADGQLWWRTPVWRSGLRPASQFIMSVIIFRMEAAVSESLQHANEPCRDAANCIRSSSYHLAEPNISCRAHDWYAQHTAGTLQHVKGHSIKWVEPAVHACISEAAFASRKWEAGRGVFYLLFLPAYAFTVPITFLTALNACSNGGVRPADVALTPSTQSHDCTARQAAAEVRTTLTPYP
jgi:hypothetical protein